MNKKNKKSKGVCHCVLNLPLRHKQEPIQNHIKDLLPGRVVNVQGTVAKNNKASVFNTARVKVAQARLTLLSCCRALFCTRPIMMALVKFVRPLNSECIGSIFSFRCLRAKIVRG